MKIVRDSGHAQDRLALLLTALAICAMVLGPPILGFAPSWPIQILVSAGVGFALVFGQRYSRSPPR